MAQKNAHPTKRQGEIIAKCGLSTLTWVVVKEHNHTLIIKNRFTGEFKVIEK